ncbi:DUF4259 domain-containing protein [Micromonospora endophytica]|uniref:Uncharacterized protein n=1 Tax=Micromonospora endophytica TaxID=515350 RepID=A0A2W2DX61_9ACTN|nr:DUF4259 domain-containing protein [Micromonospora endophytica]PZF97453.1 hypothetical protein C1I93_11680 [Micromonospora endophytica]RIW41364.1 DUF4259 domain-containing protein [Micromonospora endophytica]BCJ58338.1 hypothetical protein Jiend_17600 [Micromonospora endophytica]
MATWQFGPFDNDDAVEWCGALEDSAPDRRTDLVRRTLEAAVVAGSHLSPSRAAQVIAAAATVVQSLTGRPSSDSAYAPRFLLGRDDIKVNSSLREMAIRALDTVLTTESQWRLRWVDNIEEEEALKAIEELRVSLESENP